MLVERIDALERELSAAREEARRSAEAALTHETARAQLETRALSEASVRDAATAHEREQARAALEDATSGLGRGGRRSMMALGALSSALAIAVVVLGWRDYQREFQSAARLWACVENCHPAGRSDPVVERVDRLLREAASGVPAVSPRLAEPASVSLFGWRGRRTVAFVISSTGEPMLAAGTPCDVVTRSAPSGAECEIEVQCATAPTVRSAVVACTSGGDPLPVIDVAGTVLDPDTRTLSLEAASDASRRLTLALGAETQDVP